MDKVSIVIPAYNHAAFLGDAIKSVIDQSYPIHEIIVVDDGSTDNTKTVACQYKQIDYYYKTNSGSANAINYGIEKSTGSYIGILNDDDTYSKNHVSTALSNLKTYGNELFVGKPLIIGEGRKYFELKHQIQLSEFEINNSGLIGSLFRNNWSLSTSSFVFNKKISTGINGFQNFASCPDLDFLLRTIFEFGASVGTSKNPTWSYRCHLNNSVSFIDSGIQFAEILYVLGRVYYQFNGNKLSSSFKKLVGYGVDPMYLVKLEETKPWILEDGQTVSESLNNWKKTFIDWYSQL
jgi:glycosyltransferase involved in cell wall biosynthesis